MKGRIITTEKAPMPIGPYSQAIAAGNMVFISGQIPLDPTSGTVTGTSIEEQTTRALANLLAVLAAEGLSAEHLVKTTVFLADIADFPAFNTVYASMLGGCRPARSVVAVAGLPKMVLVEIEAVACR